MHDFKQRKKYNKPENASTKRNTPSCLAYKKFTMKLESVLDGSQLFDGL